MLYLTFRIQLCLNPEGPGRRHSDALKPQRFSYIIAIVISNHIKTTRFHLQNHKPEQDKQGNTYETSSAAVVVLPSCLQWFRFFLGYIIPASC